MLIWYSVHFYAPPQTALVLPGSANAIGGQGAVIKLRPPTDRSPTGMLLESPYETNTTLYDRSAYFRFRQMKYVCSPSLALLL